MPLNTNGFDSLMTDIGNMANQMDADGAGAPIARRILLPANQCRTSIPGTVTKTRAQLTEEAVQMILQLCKPQG